jgi:hypothetical protein
LLLSDGDGLPKTRFSVGLILSGRSQQELALEPMELDFGIPADSLTEGYHLYARNSAGAGAHGVLVFQ